MTAICVVIHRRGKETVKRGGGATKGQAQVKGPEVIFIFTEPPKSPPLCGFFLQKNYIDIDCFILRRNKNTICHEFYFIFLKN